MRSQKDPNFALDVLPVYQNITKITVINLLYLFILNWPKSLLQYSLGEKVENTSQQKNLFLNILGSPVYFKHISFLKALLSIPLFPLDFSPLQNYAFFTRKLESLKTIYARVKKKGGGNIHNSMNCKSTLKWMCLNSILTTALSKSNIMKSG